MSGADQSARRKRTPFYRTASIPPTHPTPPPCTNTTPGSYLCLDIIGGSIDEESRNETFTSRLMQVTAINDADFGLSLSQSLVGEVGGIITVQCRNGQGSVFSLHLPAVQAA